MTVLIQPTAKQYNLQVARVQAIYNYIAGADILVSHALGGVALVMLSALLARAAAAPAGSIERLGCYAELQAVPQVP